MKQTCRVHCYQITFKTMSYSLHKRKTLLTFIIISFCVTTLYILNYNALKEPYVINKNTSDLILCHYFTEGNALASVEDLPLSSSNNSIFFHETSCKGNLNSRQACSVESAARLHPERSVYVLFNSPVTEETLRKSALSRLVRFKNVKLARLRTAEYAKGTVLEDMLANKVNTQSNWPIEHTADMLRFISLYKYGGVYLDTDMLVVKPLDPLGVNWVGREDQTVVNVAALAVDKVGIGHYLISNILEDLKSNFRPKEWIYNGPGAMKRAMLKFCGITSNEILDLTTERCHGFRICLPSELYPIHWQYSEIYFMSGNLPESTETAYTHHLWNKLTHGDNIDEGSPYDKLSKKFCPSIRYFYGDDFGL